MTLDEAIAINKSQIPNAMPNNPPHRLEALQLGIEALKAWQNMRAGDNQPELWTLPGETKE